MNKIEKINVNGEDYELSVPVDDTLNLTSTNPVQNKVITETINKIKEENTGYKTITWTNESNMNNYKEEGIFIINGVHSNSGDNVPITAYAKGNIGGVLSIAKSTSDSKAGEYIIGQHLVLANRVGGETKEYIRSCIVKNEIETWTPWKESGMIKLFGEKASGIATKTDIDSAIDNGQYAGVYMDADGFLPQGATFTLTVINNYAATAASSLPAENRQVTQVFIYTPLSRNGNVNKSIICKRDGIGGSSISWGELENIKGDKPINDGDIVLSDKTTMTLDAYKASGRSDAIGVIIDAAKKLFVRKDLIYDPLIGDEVADEIKDILVDVCNKNSNGEDILNNLVVAWNLKYMNNSGNFMSYFPIFYNLSEDIYGFGHNAFIIDITLAKRIFSTDTINKSLNHLNISDNNYVTCNVYKQDSVYKVFYYCFGAYQSSVTVTGEYYYKLIVDIL